MTVPDWLTWGADAASVAGPGITVAVWFQTKALRKAFALRGRLPELSRELGSASERILDMLQRPNDDAQRSEVELERLTTILKNLLPKLARAQREPVVQLLKKCDRNRRRHPFVRAAERRRFTVDQVWEIYSRTEGLVESLKQTAKDFKWVEGMTSESKGFQLVLRLTRATVDKEIQWKMFDAPRFLTAGTDDLIPFYLEGDYKGQRIALFERRRKGYDGERDSFYWFGYSAVAILDGYRRVVWEFAEESSALDNLLKVARESATHVDTILDSLLA